MSRHFFQRCAVITLILICPMSHLARATTIDQSPRPSVLLTKSEQVIVQNAWNSVALYNFDDGEAIRTFPAGGRVNLIEASSDEQLLLIACDNGEIGVWNITTGNKLWWLTSSRSGLGYIYGASFSGDCKSLIACNQSDFALVFDALAGMQIGRVSFPPMETNIMSGSLSPDGTNGAFVDLGERLFTFDTQTGLMTDTKLKGAWPVRYSADGKYIALRSSNSGTDEQLRIVATTDLAKKDVGQFSHIGHIKPTRNGGFLVCALAGGNRFTENAFTVGMEYRPTSRELKEVWKVPITSAGNRTDFDPKLLIGVSTDFRLVTRLIDLRTGQVRLTIDNSANYRENILSYTSMGFPAPCFPWLVLALAMVGVFIAYVLISKRRTKSPPAA